MMLVVVARPAKHHLANRVIVLKLVLCGLFLCSFFVHISSKSVAEVLLNILTTKMLKLLWLVF